jgi:hypothetical protein
MTEVLALVDALLAADAAALIVSHSRVAGGGVDGDATTIASRPPRPLGGDDE